MIQKTCSRCKSRKTIDQFGKDKYNSDGLNGRCKTCVKQMNDKYRSSDPEKFKKINRESLSRRRKEKYVKVKATGGTCSKCKTAYGPENFYKNKNSSTGRDSWCKPCRMEYTTLKTYSITKEQFDELKAAHNGFCAICKIESKLFIDHNHSSGSVRGLLCLSCNFGLGHFKDSEALLLSAIEYLKIY